jgi:hypothetical protein
VTKICIFADLSQILGLILTASNTVEWYALQALCDCAIEDAQPTSILQSHDQKCLLQRTPIHQAPCHHA